MIDGTAAADRSRPEAMGIDYTHVTGGRDSSQSDTVQVVALALGPTAGLGPAPRSVVAVNYRIIVRGLSQFRGRAAVGGDWRYTRPRGTGRDRRPHAQRCRRRRSRKRGRGIRGGATGPVLSALVDPRPRIAHRIQRPRRSPRGVAAVGGTPRGEAGLFDAAHYRRGVRPR